MIISIFYFATTPITAAQDETPYSVPGWISSQGKPPDVVIKERERQQPKRPASSDSPGKPGEPQPPKQGESTPAPIPPGVVVAPSPQVITGSGRNFGNITLRVDPLLIRIKENEIIDQDIILDNPRGVTIDEADILLKYNPKYVEPLDYDTTLPGINLKSNIHPKKNPGIQVILNQVDTENAEVHLKLKSLSPNVYIGGKMATIQWLAKQPTFHTPITFGFPTDPKSPGTKVRRLGKDLLGWDFDPTDGVITGGIAIAPLPAKN